MQDYSTYSDIVYKIIGASMNVHSELNWGLLESLYNEALQMELKMQGIESDMQKMLPCYYRGEKMEKTFFMDLVVGDVIVELKSVRAIVPAHRAQLFNYMRLSKSPIGLLINFGQPSLQGERYGYDPETNECHLLDRFMNVIPLEDDCYDDDTPF